MTIRSKFKLTRIEESKWSPQAVGQKTLVFTTQYDTTIPEDLRFCKATPQGEIRMVVDNPVALEQFVLGADYYFDASPVPAAAA